MRLRPGRHGSDSARGSAAAAPSPRDDAEGDGDGDPTLPPSLGGAPPSAIETTRLDIGLRRLAVGIGVLGVGTAAVLTQLYPAVSGQPSIGRWAYAALALLLAGAAWLPPRWLRDAATLWSLALVATTTLRAVELGWVLTGPGWTMLPLTVCFVYVLCGASRSIVVALAAALAAAWIAAARTVQPLPLPPPELSSAMLLGAYGVALAGAVACGAVLDRTVRRHTDAAAEREQRFRRLLTLAADAYWEIDADYRLVSASEQQQPPQQRQLRPTGGLGRRPWDLPRFACPAEVLDELLADLDSRLPFRERPVRWDDPTGRARQFLVSGEPRFDADGVFRGYWGVARDVTAVHDARDALRATETRYQELFSRIPTPLVLHRRQQVLDANPAALAMFGHADLASMVGTDLYASFDSGDSRERGRRRSEQLDAAPVGTALPVADFKLQVQARALAVRAAGVRVDAPEGPATLAIFIDETERLAAEQAVRRSEALLSHLVATSPDLITLTDHDSGRYVMVNQAFERTIGWSAEEAVGHTSLELGVWADAAARQRFVDAFDADATVRDLPVAFVRRDGTPLPLLVSAARFAMDRREYVVINGRDVSERERSRLEREAILGNASIGIAVVHERQFSLTNAHFDRMYGWPAGTLTGQPTDLVWHDRAEYETAGERARLAVAQSRTTEFEATGRRRDGSTFTMWVRGSALDPTQPALTDTVWIVEDVTERRAAEQALARARDEAEAASRAKSAFLANTSHELRTPLNGLIGLAHLARQDDTAPALRAHYLAQIVDIAQALAGVISDILDVSKIEAGKLEIEHTVFDLGELMATLAATHGLLAQSHPARLRFEVDEAVRGPVRGDPVRLRQVIGNLVGNALKFTTAGEVVVTVRRLAERVRIEVRDTGPGIDQATQQRLFEPFMQADQSTTRRFGGTGLGLSITRELTQRMGGEVGVVSSPGVGSTFWAELPLPQAPALPATAAAATEATLHGARVLMADDNAVNLLIAVAMLQRWGVDVVQASDGRQAVDAVRAAHAAGRPVDAVLMDVQMPVMGGHEATRRLRADPAGASVPVIALTAAALVTERDAALQAGMNDFLTKPIDAERLHATLLRWCGRPLPTPSLFAAPVDDAAG